MYILLSCNHYSLVSSVMQTVGSYRSIIKISVYNHVSVLLCGCVGCWWQSISRLIVQPMHTIPFSKFTEADKVVQYASAREVPACFLSAVMNFLPNSRPSPLYNAEHAFDAQSPLHLCIVVGPLRITGRIQERCEDVMRKCVPTIPQHGIG